MATSTIGSTALFGQVAGLNNREDLMELITLVDPYETPLYSMIQKGTAAHTLHEWQTEALQATATGGNDTFAEGAAFSASTLNDRTRLHNLCEIFRKDVQVSNTQRAVRPAGIKDEYIHQIQIGVKEIGRNIEVTLFQGEAGSATGSDSTVRTMKVLRNFITTNSFATSSTAVGCTGTGFSGTSYAVGELMFNSVLESCYLSGGRVDTVFCNGSSKRQISRFSGGGGAFTSGSNHNRRNVDASGKRLVASVDSYDSDFGIVTIILNRFVGQIDGGAGVGTANADNKIYFLQMDTWECAVLRPLKHVPLPPGGDSVRGMVLTELTLSAYAEQWNGLLAGVSSTLGAVSDGSQN